MPQLAEENRLPDDVPFPDTASQALRGRTRCGMYPSSVNASLRPSFHIGTSCSGPERGSFSDPQSIRRDGVGMNIEIGG
jgi:hypothetical protein